ncbi:bolA-like protein 2 isoform X3 [Bos mutus]|uniref:bolA-like protein 2 isoform X3 n=1 Tax=Bos mutus TaxID=72004 RepID=UPI0038B62E1A
MPRVQVEGSPQAPSSLNIPGTSGSDHREVEDTTPNRCASSFRVLVVSAKFEGKPLLQRHRFPGPGELVTTRKSASLGEPNIALGQAQAEATDKAQVAAARCRKGSELDGRLCHNSGSALSCSAPQFPHL